MASGDENSVTARCPPVRTHAAIRQSGREKETTGGSMFLTIAAADGHSPVEATRPTSPRLLGRSRRQRRADAENALGPRCVVKLASLKFSGSCPIPNARAWRSASSCNACGVLAERVSIVVRASRCIPTAAGGTLRQNGRRIGRFLQNKVGIRAADAQRVDRCPARQVAGGPGLALGVEQKRGFGEMDRRVGAGIMETRRKRLVLQRQRRLMSPATPAAASRWPMFVLRADRKNCLSSVPRRNAW